MVFISIRRYLIGSESFSPVSLDRRSRSLFLSLYLCLSMLDASDLSPRYYVVYTPNGSRCFLFARSNLVRSTWHSFLCPSRYLSANLSSRDAEQPLGPVDDASINTRNYRNSKRENIQPRRDRSRTVEWSILWREEGRGKVFHRVCTIRRALVRALLLRIAHDVREKRDSTRKLRERSRAAGRRRSKRR